mgnify:FL=1
MSCGKRDWAPEALMAFERHIADRFLAGEIHAPIHLSGGNEEKLLDIFKHIQPEDWVLSTHRSHYHALLHGISPDWVEAEILARRSMHLNSPEHHFLTSAIVGGIAPIAVGIAMGLKRNGDNAQVWCFLGDMAAEMGIVHEATKYAAGRGTRGLGNLRFVIEDNGLSTNTPTQLVWKGQYQFHDTSQERYEYERLYPHTGVGTWVQF